MANKIELHHIYKAYGDKQILEDFNLSIEKGEFVTIIGTSGCGKTTVLKMINGLIRPDKGYVSIDNQDISLLDQNELRRNIGYAIQGSVLFPHLSVADNISYVLQLTKSKNSQQLEEAIDKWMRVAQLPTELKDSYPHELSGGQQQRVSIARALAANPEIVLMDEPFSAVDEVTRMTLQEELYQIYQQTQVTIVFVTHDISEALRLGTKVLVMDKGKIHQYGTPAELMNHPETEFVEKLINQKRRLFQL